MQKRIAAFYAKVKNQIGGFASDKTIARKERDQTVHHDISTDDYVKDWHGSVVRNYTKSAPKKVRSKARQVVKLKAMASGLTMRELRKSWHAKAETV